MAKTKAAATCRRAKKGTKDKKPVSLDDPGLCSSQQPLCMSDTGMESQSCSLPLATSYRCPWLTHRHELQHGPDDPSCRWECARCSGHFPVPVFPLRSLSPASSCRPGGEVQWSAETSAPIRTSGRLRRRICHLRKAKRKNLEQRKRRAKKRGHRCTAGLLLGKALLCPAALNKPWNRTQGILENRVHDAQLR